MKQKWKEKKRRRTHQPTKRNRKHTVRLYNGATEKRYFMCYATIEKNIYVFIYNYARRRQNTEYYLCANGTVQDYMKLLYLF